MLNGLSSEEFFCGQLDAFLVQDCSGRGAGRGPAGMLQAQSWLC